jgi:hypothetical protein
MDLPSLYPVSYLLLDPVQNPHVPDHDQRELERNILALEKKV